MCTENIYQFDLRPDIEASKVKIATWDGYFNPYATIFYLAALAPDGKIYISNTSSTYNLHVIHKPNCPGLSCELEQHGIVLPSYNYATIPNLPHYNILDTSYDCDTSISTEVANAEDRLLIFPNPATDQLHISGLEGNVVVTITDVSGKTVFLKKGAWPGRTGDD
ncbi:MAG: T9SS type A sorting domain-containing protein [Lewinellaceae bacterium]|nr:T9SS type A sorting domain-containing protein [Lewinellaceae bacterium]